MLRHACTAAFAAAAACLSLGACAGEARTTNERATDAAVEMDARATDPAPCSDGAVDSSDAAVSGPVPKDGATTAPLDAEPHDVIDASVDAAAPADASLHDAELPDAASDAQLFPDAPDPCEAGSIEPADGEHACLHASHGPFVSLALSATAQGAPDASRAHTAFQLTWPQGDPIHGFIRFRAAQAGTFAVFSASAEVASVTSASRDDSLPVTRPTQTHCDRLPSAALIDLVASEWSVIQLARLQGGQAQVVIERISALRSMPDSCAYDDDDAGSTPPLDCRSDGPCRFDHECCSFCHDEDHCH